MGGSKGREKRSYRDVLKVQLTGFAGGLEVECEKHDIRILWHEYLGCVIY